MSALIITSHVKKGTELAERYKLGQEIIDIIRQHHGTRVIRYFYQKAINMGERPRESDFELSRSPAADQGSRHPHAGQTPWRPPAGR